MHSWKNYSIFTVSGLFQLMLMSFSFIHNVSNVGIFYFFKDKS